VFSLRWDTEADLDLRVVDPSGTEVWSRKVSASPVPPGGDPSLQQGGILDFDSNSQCVIDGRRRENVFFTQPPSGHYLARVDTFSLCGEPLARWTLAVMLDGVVIAQSHGVGTPDDAAFKHDQGAGVLASEFDVP